MSFGDILGQMIQKGLSGSEQSNPRLRTTADNLSQQGGTGLDAILGQLQGALGGQGAGGLADRAGDFLRKDQVGTLSGAQIGGIGALAGAVLGGGFRGAARGGAMAMLGTLALAALKNAQARRSGASPMAAAAAPEEVAAVTAPGNERLLLQAMISAAKADGQIDQQEMQQLVGRVSEGSVTDEEKRFVLEQMAAPVDVAGLAAQVTSPAQAAQVYAAALMAIVNDNEAERQFLRDLARALQLDDATVAELHDMTGAPRG